MRIPTAFPPADSRWRFLGCRTESATANDVTIGLLGRSKRDRDARDLEILNIEST